MLLLGGEYVLCMQKSKDNFVEFFLSFNHVVPRDGTHVVWLGHKYPHLLSRVSGSDLSFLKPQC